VREVRVQVLSDHIAHPGNTEHGVRK